MAKQDMESIGGLLGKSWRVYRDNLSKFITLIILYTLPWLAVGLVTTLFKAANYLLENNTVWLVLINIFLAVLMLGGLLLGIVVYFSSQAAIFVLVQKEKTKLSVSKLFYEGKKYAWDYFVLGLFSTLLIFLWTLLFVIPGFIFMIYYSVAFWALFAEGKKGYAALKYSKQLVKGKWWAVFWRIFSVSFFLWAIMMIPVYFMDTKEAVDVWGDVTNVINIIVSPFLVAYSYFIYKDLLRLKKK